MYYPSFDFIIYYYYNYYMFSSPTSRSKAKTYVGYVSGPVKIKDALYMGDEVSAKVQIQKIQGYRLYCN